jgi:cob(I)alamin adenosyltransferase
MAIYTKRGDGGETGLFDEKGKERRVSKSSLRVYAIGSVDELNSAIGVARSFSEDRKTTKFLKDIQKDLLTTGSILAGSKLRFTNVKTKKLEKLIDELEGSLPVLTRFVLPGGGRFAGHLHFCRSVARRAERTIAKLNEKEEVKPQIVTYINRLSDTLFMMARQANNVEGIKDDTWKGRKP